VVDVFNGLDVVVDFIRERFFFGWEDYVGVGLVGPSSSLDNVVEEDWFVVSVVGIVFLHRIATLMSM
jgi:hypothetical protein